MTRLDEREKRKVADTCVHFNLKRSVRSVTQRFDAVLAPSGLRVTQFNLLVASSLLGTAQLGELADVLDLERTTLTRNLKPLERDGLLKTRGDEADARVRLVEVTPAGEAVIARAYPLWQQAQEEVLSGFGDETYAGLLGSLEHLRSSAHGQTSVSAEVRHLGGNT